MCLPNQVQGIVRTMSEILSCPLTLKMRTGYAIGELGDVIRYLGNYAQDAHRVRNPSPSPNPNPTPNPSPNPKMRTGYEMNAPNGPNHPNHPNHLNHPHY